MNFGFQEQRAGGGTIPNNTAIAFNRTIVNYDTNISYNDSTFTISSPGDYYVAWNVALKTGLGVNGPTISLVTNTTPVQTFPSTNNMKTGQISGSAVLKVTTAPTTFQLVNTTGNSIVLADNVEISANISIIAINPQTAGANYYLTDRSGGNLAGDATVPFNETITEFNDLVTNTTGTITISNAGRYIVEWSVSLYGSSDSDYIKFNVVLVSETETTILGSNESPVVHPGTVYGNALINITDTTRTTPYELELRNASFATVVTPETTQEVPSDLTFASQSIQATIRIVQI